MTQSATLERDQTVDTVRSFYETFPYPPPERDLSPYRDGRVTVVGSPAHYASLYWPRGIDVNDVDILVAGCGTSQAAKFAIQQPTARVVGIDISETSLDHTRALAEQYGLSNLTVLELPIEEAAALDRAFDLVVSTGVIHHLDDPLAGLRALRSVLAPHGALHLMVYAQYGRTGVYMMQDFCRLLDVQLNLDETDALMRTVDHVPDDHPIATFDKRGQDLRHPMAIADALLHPRDVAYTVPELYALLDDAGLTHMRWLHEALYTPTCGMTRLTPWVERIASLPSRERHAAMELFRGTLATHEFITCRDDRPRDDYEITFDGEAWRSYVPRRAPGAQVLEGATLPPGIAAILHEPKHKYPDLQLPLDETQTRLCQLIDGVRTIPEILQVVAPGGLTPETEAYGRGFFKMLWEYDQVYVTIREAGQTPAAD